MSQSDLCPYCPLHYCAPWRPTPPSICRRRMRRIRPSSRPPLPSRAVTSADTAKAPTSDAIHSSICVVPVVIAPRDVVLGKEGGDDDLR
jgi:hypothetical protein